MSKLSISPEVANAISATETCLRTLRDELQALQKDSQTRLSMGDDSNWIKAALVLIDAGLNELVRRPHLNLKSWRDLLHWDTPDQKGSKYPRSGHPARDVIDWVGHRYEGQTLESALEEHISDKYAPEIAAQIDVAKLCRQIRREAKKEPPAEYGRYVFMPVEE